MKRLLGILSLCVCAITLSAKPAYRGPTVEMLPDGTAKVQTAVPLRRAPQADKSVGEKPNPAPRGLVILVSFKDVTFQTPKDTIDSMLNAVHFTRKYTYLSASAVGKPTKVTIKSQGSARRYFQDQSYGAYSPVFDVIGPLTVSQKAEYYGADEDAKAYEMIKEACELADGAGVNFKQYDYNNDGYVDFVYVIYAGFGEADGGGENTVWPHQSDLSYYRYRHDGKYIGRYACGCEMNNISKVYDGIGTFCHEFSHVLGLPDLYETNKNSLGLHTLYNWDIMDYGAYNNDGNTPPAYSAYERFYMGWLQPRLLDEPEYVTLPPLNEGEGGACVITTNNVLPESGWQPNPSTFYILETRTKTGWDQYLPGEGMLITKVSYSSLRWRANNVNNSARAMGVDIMEARENTDSIAKPTDAYPAGAEAWTALMDHEITNIERGEKDASVSFSYRGAEKPSVGIEDISEKEQARKIFRDGHVYIVLKDKIYDILGRVL